jgi:hypothetical protein
MRRGETKNFSENFQWGSEGMVPGTSSFVLRPSPLESRPSCFERRVCLSSGGAEGGERSAEGDELSANG